MTSVRLATSLGRLPRQERPQSHDVALARPRTPRPASRPSASRALGRGDHARREGLRSGGIGMSTDGTLRPARLRARSSRSRWAGRRSRGVEVAAGPAAGRPAAAARARPGRGSPVIVIWSGRLPTAAAGGGSRRGPARPAPRGRAACASAHAPLERLQLRARQLPAATWRDRRRTPGPPRAARSAAERPPVAAGAGRDQHSSTSALPGSRPRPAPRRAAPAKRHARAAPHHDSSLHSRVRPASRVRRRS